MDFLPKYEKLRLVLWTEENIGVYLIFLHEVPLRIDAPGFLVPPKRELVIRAVRKVGWEVRLGKWFSRHAKSQPAQHTTYWSSKIFWPWPL
jgi:hypothetical protein